MMIRPFGLFLLSLPVAAAIPAGSAQAQYYPGAPPAYYRSGPPPVVYQDRLPPPGYRVDDDDQVSVPLRPLQRRQPQMSQQLPPPVQEQPGAPRSILRYPADDAAAPPPPGFAAPDGRQPVYGHQLDRQTPAAGAPPPVRTRAESDPDAIRPPASIGTAPNGAPQPPASPSVNAALPPEDQPEVGKPKELPANLKRQLVDYASREPAGTLIVDTPNTYLYLVLGGGKAIRYGIGVGREGFTWAGGERVSKMKEWPDWFPPAEMIERQPYLPRVMAGGPGNPLGARALYLGNTLYRIHGTNQPSTIGSFVSSGCIRLINEDIEDLYNRVQVGTRVVVLPGKAPDTVAASGNPPQPANPMAPPPRAGTAVSSSPLPPLR